jgi:cellulose synthase-like protein
MSSDNAPSKKALRSGAGGSQGAGSSRGSMSDQKVKFARRTSSGRYINMSQDELSMSGEISGDYMNYTVQIPPTPDNQPMDEESVAMKAEEQYVSNSLFTGGFNSVTRAHLMDRVIESNVNHPQMVGNKVGSVCGMPSCDGSAMVDERGHDVDPCECRYVDPHYS